MVRYKGDCHVSSTSPNRRPCCVGVPALAGVNAVNLNIVDYRTIGIMLSDYRTTEKCVIVCLCLFLFPWSGISFLLRREEFPSGLCAGPSADYCGTHIVPLRNISPTYYIYPCHKCSNKLLCSISVFLSAEGS